MLIANPIYDSVFKFLMEDLTVAKRLLSTIIGEEIVELEVRPQEQTRASNKYLLTVFRVDFKAIIKTETGALKKVLIELQKSKNAFDIMRFRHYLGANYSKMDDVDGIPTVLPILPIYFLGFKLSVPSAVLKVGRQYEDLQTGAILTAKDAFIENLSHDCFVVQIPNLTQTTQTKLEKMLSIFNQKWIVDKDQRWLLRYSENVDDADMTLILKRLAMAAESEEVQERIQAEDDLDMALENSFREKELQIERQEKEMEEKNKALEEQGKALEDKDKALEDKDKALEAEREKNIALQRQLDEFLRKDKK